MDTRENTWLDIKKTVYTVASFTGINCAAKMVFHEIERDYVHNMGYFRSAYALNTDNSIIEVNKKQFY